MKYLPLLLLFSSLASYAQFDYCVEQGDQFSEIADINKSLLNSTKQTYYLYFEGKSIEELQILKNCIDYSKCGKSKESIVDDPKNYRIHIWDKFTKSELQRLINLCPIPNIQNQILIRRGNNEGEKITLVPNRTESEAQTAGYRRAANPAVFTKISPKSAEEAMKKISAYLKDEKTTEATDLILKTWNIDLHGYDLIYTKKPGSYATADHQKRQISYAKDWLANPCDFVRMIRHEAEHVTQVKQMRSCGGDHNFSDHKMRERAAHLNDALFIGTVCPHAPERVKSIRDFCVKRFKNNYFNN